MSDEQPIQSFQRKQLLERIERDGATVGSSIPETITIQGEEIDLQQFVFEIRRRDTIPAGERERVDRAKTNLRRERRQRKQRIEDDPITHAEGEQLAESIIGIDRALTELQSLGPVDIEGETRAQETADTKRWMSFLQKALGHTEDNSGPGVSKRR